jgi:hypothetical protein
MTGLLMLNGQDIGSEAVKGLDVLDRGAVVDVHAVTLDATQWSPHRGSRNF